MLFMNTWDIEDAQHRWRDHPALGPATQTLAELEDWANTHSDGWAYWPKPCRAAKALQELIQNADRQWRNGREATVDAQQVRKAYVPIKSFLTRQGDPAGIDFIEPRN